jgi:DNA polymerase
VAEHPVTAAPDSPDQLLADLREHLLLDQEFGLAFCDPTAALVMPVAVPSTPESPMPAPRERAPAAPVPVHPPGLLPAAALDAVAAEAKTCRACGLCAERRNPVPGEGNPAAELVFVGEAPGAEEDEQGRPFVGRSGELLLAMVAAMGFSREEIFIANVVKCRPPGNRAPARGEIAACLPYLQRQLLAIRPRVIVTLGNTALRAVMGDEKLGITTVRGTQLSWQGIPVMPTFHPAYLLRNPPAKKPCWEDLKGVMAFLGRPLPRKP